MKRAIPAIVCLVWLLCSPLIHHSQYVNVTSSLGISHHYSNDYFGGGVSFFDWNDDGWDDLVFSSDGFNCKFYQNNGGTFSLVPAFFPNSGQVRSINWVDYDNDGDHDLFVARFASQSSLYNNNGNLVFSDVTVAAGFPSTLTWYSTCQAWGDYDSDGDLDLYLGNYNGLGYMPNVSNKLFRNEGNGTFTETTVSAGVGNGFHNTFGAVWFDYDNDLDVDLYVANDRTNCPNNLYRNDGNGTFTDMSAYSGVLYYIFSMCATTDDYDNDGWLDLFVTNNPYGHLMHHNNGNGTFTEVAAAAGTISNYFGWGSLFLDYDNDQYLDLHVCHSPHWTPGENKLFHNDGDGTFTETSAAMGVSGNPAWNHGSAQGDYNNDGFPDIAINCNTPNSSALFKAPQNDNHWLKVTLEGTVSNRDGIGSKIEVWVEGERLTRYTLCGEGYLGQNSQHELFGLGTASTADSVIVKWPSGIVDKLFYIPAGQSISVEEGSTFVPLVLYSDDLNLCPGESIMLFTPAGYAAYQWNNGQTTSSIMVSTPGYYNVTVADNFGNIGVSETITVNAVQPTFSFDIDSPTCHDSEDGSIQLNDVLSQVHTVTWENGTLSPAIDGLAGGSYICQVIDQYGCLYIDTLAVSAPDSLTAQLAVVHNLCFGDADGSIEITEVNATQYSVQWDSGAFGTSQNNLQAGLYHFAITDQNGCTGNGFAEVTEPDPVLVSLEVSPAPCFGDPGSVAVSAAGGTGIITMNWDNEALSAMPPGSYYLELTDENGCSVTQLFEVLTPDPLSVELTVTPENSLGSLGTVSIAVYGGTPPYLCDWGDGPTTSMTLTGLAAGDYTTVVTDANGCVLHIDWTVDYVIGVEASHAAAEAIYYAVGSQTLMVLDTKAPGTVLLFDTRGRMLISHNHQPGKSQIDLSALSPGTYIVTYRTARHSQVLRVVVE